MASERSSPDRTAALPGQGHSSLISFFLLQHVCRLIVKDQASQSTEKPRGTGVLEADLESERLLKLAVQVALILGRSHVRWVWYQLPVLI